MKLTLLAVLMMVLAACVDTPKKTTQVVDDRPRLAFDLSLLGASAADHQLLIDGINYGAVDQYRVDENAVRVISGRHLVEIKRLGQVVFSQEVVLGENTTRVIKVPGYE